MGYTSQVRARRVRFPTMAAAGLQSPAFPRTSFVALTRSGLSGTSYMHSQRVRKAPGHRTASPCGHTLEQKMNFETLGIAPALLRALNDAGYTTPTPIQAQAIPLVLSGEDVLGGAQTGTGKTAAFGLPLVQHLSKQTAAKGPRKPRALVLVPTRELAVQVSDSIKSYSRYLRLNVTTLFGGAGMQPQINNLQRGVDVLVACPGRLLDHLERGTVKLDAVEILVLDEADRMLDMGFLPAIKRVLARVP